MYTIYQIINTVNQKSYIGFTIKNPEERFLEHKAESSYRGKGILYQAMRKYGTEMFILESLEEGQDHEQGLRIREPFWIKKLNPDYNMTAGGEGCLGYRHTKDHRNHMSIIMRGRTHSQKHRKSVSAAKTGVRYSQRKIICPFCEREGGSSNMKRWHFDNCRRKP